MERATQENALLQRTGLSYRFDGRAVVGLIVVSCLAACGDGDRLVGAPPIGAASNLEIAAGDRQSAEIGTTLKEAFALRVLDEDERPVPNVVVRWSVEDGEGHVSSESSITDQAGLAEVVYTAGLQPGHRLIKASVASGYFNLTFQAYVFPERPPGSVVYLLEDRRVGGSFARYVLFENATFELQQVHHRLGFLMHTGSYVRTDTAIEFKFDGATTSENSWHARGIITNGDLDLEYDVLVYLNGPGPLPIGTFVLVPNG